VAAILERLQQASQGRHLVGTADRDFFRNLTRATSEVRRDIRVNDEGVGEMFEEAAVWQKVSTKKGGPRFSPTPFSSD
jgi:hypothetical protein